MIPVTTIVALYPKCAGTNPSFGSLVSQRLHITDSSSSDATPAFSFHWLFFLFISLSYLFFLFSLPFNIPLSLPLFSILLSCLYLFLSLLFYPLSAFLFSTSSFFFFSSSTFSLSFCTWSLLVMTRAWVTSFRLAVIRFAGTGAKIEWRFSGMSPSVTSGFFLQKTRKQSKVLLTV